MISGNLNEILEKYEGEMKKPFKDNDFAHKMRNDFKLNFEKFIKESYNKDDFYVKCSPGRGNWTYNPWIGILDKHVSNTFQNGFYIMIEFDFREKLIFLSICQGISTNGIDYKKRAKYLYSKIKDNPQGFLAHNEISNFKDTNYSYILLKRYKQDELNDEILFKDLKLLIKIYEDLIPIYNQKFKINDDILENDTFGREYSKENFLNEVIFKEENYDNLVKLLKYKKNIILQGPPGVGKTYIAKKLAYSLIGKKDKDKVQMVQFHQNYSYEDFIQGIRPIKEGFELKNGVFYEFCKKATNDLDNDYFFIIDEINRGNISKIFGEMMMLIELDKRGEDFAVPLTYSSKEFYIPKNIHIIGMMNTTDRSLAIIDYALRRRFVFIPIDPAYEQTNFRQYLIKSKNINQKLVDGIIKKFTALNQKIAIDEDLGPDFKIGHSYFCNGLKINNENYENIINYEIAPLLKEYWFDEMETAEKQIENLLKLRNDNI